MGCHKIVHIKLLLTGVWFNLSFLELIIATVWLIKLIVFPSFVFQISYQQRH